jgi:hypothetical protein
MKFLFEHNPQSLNPEIRKNVMDFFTTHQYPKDEEVHALADKLNVDKHLLEQEIYSVLSDILSYGNYNEKKPSTINSKQLELGIKIEMEHTDCPLIAKRIALDHLSEDGMENNYYTNLINMEKAIKEKKPTINLVY